MSQAKPNIGILIATQFISMLGDAFGQRCSRVNYKRKTRHMMIGLCLMTAVQMFFFMGIFQLSLPTSITSAIYIDNVKVDCYYELDVQGKIMDCTPANCTVIPCKSQGPFSIFRSIKLHPFLLTNGLMNIIYYNGEVFLYKEPFGLIFLVISALSSTFLIDPLNIIFGEPINQPIPALIYILGITGSVISVIELTPRKFNFFNRKSKKEEEEKLIAGADEDSNKLLNNKDEYLDHQIDEQNGSSSINKSIDNIDDAIDNTSLLSSPSLNINSDKQEQQVEEQEESQQTEINQLSNSDNNNNNKSKQFVSILIRGLKILIPITLLALANALWMETSLFYNDQFRTNAFGYNSLDQCLLPFYLFPFMLLIDVIKPLKNAFLSEEETKESLVQAVKSTWNETSLWTLFIYRFLINGRAIMYFYLAIEYDLTMVYLESTLIRVFMNSIGAVLLNLIVPKWIDATPEERKRTFYPVNLFLRLAGSAGVVVSLLILNK
ncbi:hypothetical protein DICPUDRAFT_79130 [Dictyostelium purpureum]|uniref:Transmembrane protein n=1 Tax=Dictyostelium purpureum TaxID=5786 RepID=F0ZLN4_DICPU|nr:uncharacterized protein DICPUDRAFT_79130 [Dictyostelium purpureum]EGC35129.1 hypothetical protein DICPUDRAFT_79130 [Dictyostelium purpureum]|eukprot:XP_003288322.1 hypothetical protein DICPUDRAFT_79130 [Dictyostelium purpureum]